MYEILEEFLKKSSIKALAKIAKSTEKMSKILWIFALFLGVSVASYLLTHLLIASLNSKFITKVFKYVIMAE